MVTISLCMIVKNEEETLARCLNSVRDLVDEINIVDTGSNDHTVDIARQFTDRIFFHAWNGDFAAARNASFGYATQDYILYLDADDVLLEEDLRKLKELKSTLDPSVDSVSMYYDAGTDEFGNVTLRYRRNRLVRRDHQFQWRGECHVYLDVRGTVIHSDIAVTHRKIRHSVGRNLNIYGEKIARGDILSARDHFYYGNELRENGHYDKAIVQYRENLERADGWKDDKIHACIFMADCYRLLGNTAQELAFLLKTMEYAAPRPEALCRIGYHFLRNKDYQTACFWFELATASTADSEQWSFSYPAYSTWYPHLQLCICYYYLGDLQKAYDHNEEARKYRPEDAHVLHNHKLLESRLAKTDIRT